MKKYKVIFLTLSFFAFSAISISKAHSHTVSNFSVKLNSQGLYDVYSGLKFHYLDKEDRLLIMNDFFKAVELDYALLPIKSKRIGLDFNKLKSDTLSEENEIESIIATAEERSNLESRERISFLQAKSNMGFLDRMQMLVAQFKDTHFNVLEKIARPAVYTGIFLYRVGGKVIVGSIEKKFMGMAQALSGTDYSKIAMGDEVLSINGEPVEKKVNFLKKFIAGSSDEFVDSLAVNALTMRSFGYDESNFITINFKNAGVFKLPLFMNNSFKTKPRLDAITYLKKFSIPTDAASMGISFDKVNKTWEETSMLFEGYNPRRMAPNLIGVNEMIGEDGNPAIKTGYYMTNGKSYGVLQVFTFMSMTVKFRETKMSFIDGVRSFIAELKENKLPLIIDLRFNPGGSKVLASKLLSVIAPEKALYAGVTDAFRMTSYVRQIEEPSFYQEVVGEDLNIGVSSDEMNSIFDKTIDEKGEFTPMIASQTIPYDFEKIKGFNNKVVALVTSHCVSACDQMLLLLKSSKRAIIIGSQSNGTGAGFISTKNLNTTWVDPLRFFEGQVPNILFGAPGATVEQKIFNEHSAEEMCSENRPTVADITYFPTMLDVAKNNLGWLQKAASVIETIPN